MNVETNMSKNFQTKISYQERNAQLNSLHTESSHMNGNALVLSEISMYMVSWCKYVPIFSISWTKTLAVGMVRSLPDQSGRDQLQK